MEALEKDRQKLPSRKWVALRPDYPEAEPVGKDQTAFKTISSKNLGKEWAESKGVTEGDSVDALPTSLLPLPGRG